MLDFAKRQFKNPRLWQIALSVYWLILFVSTHMPKDTPLVPGARTDKIVHLGAFAVLAWLLATTWQLSAGWLTGGHLLAAWIAIALYGAVDELTQPLFGRYASWADWLADAAGAIIGLVLFMAMRRWCWKFFAIESHPD